MTPTARPPDREPPRGPAAATPLAAARRLAGRPCVGCSGRCTAREAVWSVALGFRRAPRCLPCLGRGLGRDPAELRTQLADYVRRRECYVAAWAEAVRLDGATPETVAAPAAAIAPAEAAADGEPDDAAWDAGPLACGELALALRATLAGLPPGAVVRVTATDPAAAEDVPSWCRLTGHALLSASPPEYRIRRKGV